MKRLIGLCTLLSSSCFATVNIPFGDPNITNISWTTNGTLAFPHGQDGPLYFTVNIGTNSLWVKFSGTNVFRFVIDGGATISVAPLSNVTPTVTLVTNALTPGNHKVWAAGSSFDTILSDPISFVTDGTGTVANTTFGPLYQVLTAPFSTYGIVTDCVYGRDTSGYPSYPLAYFPTFGAIPQEIGARYYATGSSQAIFVYTGSGVQSYALYSDGIQVGSATYYAGASFGFQLLQVTGLDPGQHLYEWVGYASGPTASLSGVQYVMPSGTLVSQVVAPRTTWGLYGDSIVANSNNGTDSRLGWSAATRSVGLDLLRMGKGGATVVGTLENDTTAITGSASCVPTVVTLQGGVNDQQAFVNAGSITTFQASVLNQLNQMATGMAANGKMLYEEILPNVAVSSGQRGNYNTAIIAAVASYNAAKINNITTCAYNTDGWINTGADTSDGLHPVSQNASSTSFPFGNPLLGYGKVSNRSSFIMSGYATGASIGISGPSSGLVGVASTNFTIAPNVAGAVFSGESFAISEASGGTFSPVSPITLTAGASAVTFTFTPATSGVKTFLIGTVPDCWSKPTNPTYNALSSGGGISLILPNPEER